MQKTVLELDVSISLQIRQTVKLMLNVCAVLNSASVVYSHHIHQFLVIYSKNGTKELRIAKENLKLR